jgi:predicted Fe-Mo cluster-binding NifX family protein
MTQKIIIPVEDASGLNAKIAAHFGRAPYYAQIELDKNGKVTNIQIDPNRGEHMGGVGHPHDSLAAMQPSAIIACAMGLGGIMSFKEAGVTVLKAKGATLTEVVANYNAGALEELTAGCPHAHEHGHSH